MNLATSKKLRRILLFVSTGTFVVIASWELYAFRASLRRDLEYAFFLSVTLLGTAIFESSHQEALARLRKLPPVVMIATGAALLLAFVPFGMRQFAGFDQSSVILSGSYMRLGIVPYSHALYTLPPGFYLGAGWALRVFGSHWWAFVAAAGVFALVTFVWLVVQFRAAGMSLIQSWAIAFVSELATVLVCGFWWYNPVTAIAIVLLFSASLAVLHSPESQMPFLGVAASVALLLLSKPNAWPALGCAGILLLSSDVKARRRAAVAIASGITFAALLCILHGFTPADVLRSYAKVAGLRGVPDVRRDAQWEPIVFAFAVFALSAFVQLVFEDHCDWTQHWREYECCALAALASLWMAFTDFELKTLDLLPLAAVIVTLAFRPWSTHPVSMSRRRVAVMFLVGFTVASSYLAVTRARIRRTGQLLFFEIPATCEIESGFFSGMRTGRRLPLVLRETNDALRRYPGNVFFGSRMEFAYEVFGMPPPRGIPLFWDAGTGYATSDVPEILDAFKADNFHTLILLKGADNIVRMPAALLREIDREYSRVDGYAELNVFIRQPSGSAEHAPQTRSLQRACSLASQGCCELPATAPGEIANSGSGLGGRP